MISGFDLDVLRQYAADIRPLCVHDYVLPPTSSAEPKEDEFPRYICHLPLKWWAFIEVDYANSLYWKLPREIKKSTKQKITDLTVYAEAKAAQYAPSVHGDAFMPVTEELLPVWTVFPHLDANYRGGLSPIIDTYWEAYIGFLVTLKQNDALDAHICNSQFDDNIRCWGGRAGLIQRMVEFERKYIRMEKDCKA